MALTASSIVRRAGEIIQDKTNVRWPVDELVRWLNDAQREVALLRPDAFTTHGSIPMVAGTRQSLPAGAVKLIDIPNNTGGTKEAMRQVTRRSLDEQSPGWHGLAGVTALKHFCYDPRDPRAFYVYPPAADAGAAVNAVYAVYPTDIVEPAAGGDYTTVTGIINTADIFANALIDYVLYRAYSKDSGIASNAGRAEAYYSTFVASVGAEGKATILVGPEVSKPGEVAGA